MTSESYSEIVGKSFLLMYLVGWVKMQLITVKKKGLLVIGLSGE